MTEQVKPPTPKKVKGKTKKPRVKVKRVRQIGVFTILFMVMLVVILLTFTPLYSVIIYFVPESYQQIITKKLHQNIILDIDNKAFSKPLKHIPNEPLTVLSERSGICFYFSSSEAENKIIDNAKKGEEIAEIIVIDDHKTEYKLKFTTRNTVLDDNYKSTVVCQIFGKDYPVPPDIVTRIYIRPIAPFTPYKTIWVTKKTIYVDNI